MVKVPGKLKRGQILTTEYMNNLRRAIIELQKRLKAKAA